VLRPRLHTRTARGQATLATSRARGSAARNLAAFAPDIASPFDLGTAAAGVALPNHYPVPAGARLAISENHTTTANQLTATVGAKVMGTPALASGQVRRLDYVERAKEVIVKSAQAGTVTLYVLDEQMRPLAIATGTVT
jgi:hypothetical protein